MMMIQSCMIYKLSLLAISCSSKLFFIGFETIEMYPVSFIIKLNYCEEDYMTPTLAKESFNKPSIRKQMLFQYD